MGKRRSIIDEFIDLPDEEKERIYQEIDRQSPEELLARSRPLNTKERALWRSFQARTRFLSDPKNLKRISITLDARLLRRADAHAKKYGYTRAQLVTRALNAILDRASSR